MRYFVTITRDTTESTRVDVEASSPEEARRLALDEANSDPNAFDWVQDDAFGGDPYLADPDAELDTDQDLADAAKGETCTACHRASIDCSRDPCPEVIADRGGDN